MINYIVIESRSSTTKQMFSDMLKIPGAVVTSNIFNISNPILKMINRIHMSVKIAEHISLPFKKIWDKFYITDAVNKNPGKKYIIILTNVSVKKFNIDYLKQLTKKDNASLVLILADSSVSMRKGFFPLHIIKQINFDLIYSFDQDDCKNYNFIYTNSIYSKKDVDTQPMRKAHLFFVGRVKGRLDQLIQIAKKADENSCVCNFLIHGADKKTRKGVKGITYIEKYITYDDALSMILSSGCLLDINQAGQSGMTPRVYDAIFYNKKLITNNKNVTQLKYYNPEYMKIINDIDEIDYNFIKADTPVDYNYKGEYSPLYLAEDIEKRLFAAVSE